MKNNNKTWTPKTFLLGPPTDTKLVQMNITGCGWCNLLAVFFSWWITLWIFTGNLPTFSKFIHNTYRLCSITLLLAWLLQSKFVPSCEFVNCMLTISALLLQITFAAVHQCAFTIYFHLKAWWTLSVLFLSSCIGGDWLRSHFPPFFFIMLSLSYISSLHLV